MTGTTITRTTRTTTNCTEVYVMREMKRKVYALILYNGLGDKIVCLVNFLFINILLL